MGFSFIITAAYSLHIFFFLNYLKDMIFLFIWLKSF